MRARNPLHRFFRSEQGNIIIFSALAIFVLVLAVGVAIDMSRTQVFKSRIQAAADAANLAAGTAYVQNNCATASSPQNCFTQYSVPKAEQIFAANLPAGYMGTNTITVTPVLSGNNINLTISASVPTSFLSIMGGAKAIGNVQVAVSSQVSVPAAPSGPVNGKCGPTVGTCASGQSSIAQEYSGTSGLFGFWSCDGTSGGNPVNCCTSETTVTTAPCASGTGTATTTTTYTCNASGVETVASVSVDNSSCTTTTYTCPEAQNPPLAPTNLTFYIRPVPQYLADGTYQSTFTGQIGFATDNNNNNSNGCMPVQFDEAAGDFLCLTGACMGLYVGDVGNFNYCPTMGAEVSGPILSFDANTPGLGTCYSDFMNYYNEAILGNGVDYEGADDAAMTSFSNFVSCMNGADAQAAILSFYTDQVNSGQITDTAGVLQAEANHCTIQYSGSYIASPLKVNIKGKNATLNTTQAFSYSMTSPKTHTTKTFKAEGGLNPNEGWLVTNCDGSGVYAKDGVVNGDNWFTDHFGTHPTAYHNLARAFSGFVKTDDKGHHYIPLSKDEAGNKALASGTCGGRALNPYKDLLVLDVQNHITPAHDYFDRIYVDNISVSESNTGGDHLKAIILQRAAVRELDGSIHLSADQWFSIPGSNFTMQSVKPSGAKGSASSK